MFPVLASIYARLLIICKLFGFSIRISFKIIFAFLKLLFSIKLLDLENFSMISAEYTGQI